MGPQLPKQGLNHAPGSGSVESQPLGRKGSLRVAACIHHNDSNVGAYTLVQTMLHPCLYPFQSGGIS